MEVECRQDAAAFDALEEPWSALHERSDSASIFNSVPYARIWWRHWGEPERLQLWTVWEDDTLVGVAPLHETVDEQGQPVLRFVGGVEASDYLDVVAERGKEGAVVVALLAAWADAPCRCPLDLHALRHASPTREAFLRVAPEWGFTVSDEPEEVCPVITLPPTWDAYLESLERKQRHELRRKMRKAGHDALVTWYRVPPSLLEEEMAHFFRLHALSSPEKATFMTAKMKEFFLDLACTFNECGWLDLAFLLMDGKRVATSLAFIFRNEVLLYNSGFDPSVHEGMSPGWLLLGYGIEEAIASGRTRYDFLRGDEEYKFRFGARSEPIYNVRLVR